MFKVVSGKTLNFKPQTLNFSFMVLATINPPLQLMLMSFIGHVRPEELVAAEENVRQLLENLQPGFRVLSDLSQLDEFEPGSAVEIGRTMNLLSQKGVGVIVRVIPDDSKDFGLNILSLFHYSPPPRIVTCETMEEAAKALAI